MSKDQVEFTIIPCEHFGYVWRKGFLLELGKMGGQSAFGVI